jgi:hypothetical protein
LAPGPEVLSDTSQWRIKPTWTINGTQKALTGDPKSYSTKQGAYFNCDDFHMQNEYSYCGYYQGTNQNGCWTRQYFPFSMETPVMNYTIRFSNNEASIEIYAESEFNETDGNTQARIDFGAIRQMPSVVDNEFWNHYDRSSYEIVKAQYDLNRVQFVPDQANMPVCMNQTESGEWYATVNATFSQEV